MCGAPLFTPRLLCFFVTEHNSISFKMCPSGDTAGERVEAMWVDVTLTCRSKGRVIGWWVCWTYRLKWVNLFLKTFPTKNSQSNNQVTNQPTNKTQIKWELRPFEEVLALVFTVPSRLLNMEKIFLTLLYINLLQRLVKTKIGWK